MHFHRKQRLTVIFFFCHRIRKLRLAKFVWRKKNTNLNRVFVSGAGLVLFGLLLFWLFFRMKEELLCAPSTPRLMQVSPYIFSQREGQANHIEASSVQSKICQISKFVRSQLHCRQKAESMSNVSISLKET